MIQSERNRWEAILRHPLATPAQIHQAKVALGLEAAEKPADETAYRPEFDSELSACLTHGLPPGWNDGGLDPRIAQWYFDLQQFLGTDPEKAPELVPRLQSAINLTQSSIIREAAARTLSRFDKFRVP